MINVAMLWFFLLPIALGAGLWFIVRDRQGSWVYALAYSIVSVLVIAGAFYGARGAATADTEIWNGQITAKSRDHGTYEESYKCRCHNVTKYRGSGKNRTSYSEEECDTCWRTHYTVKWDCQSTVGEFRIDSADSLSSSVYLLPNPGRWSSIQVGDPAARSHSYTNYVQAVPESLFTPSSPELKAKFGGLIAPYPIEVFDYYRINRFVTPGFAVPDAPQWNADISNMLRTLGPQKQVNAIVVIAKTDDPNYEYALRDAWEGVNKNDVVLLIGSKMWPKIDFVRVISWTKSETFKIELRDNVLELETIDRSKVMTLLQAQITKNFERRHMKEFEYLEGQIDPPEWLLITVFLLVLAGAGGTWYAIRRNL
jgi:hypothetical protein